MATLDIRRARDEDIAALVAGFGQEHAFRDRLARQRGGLGELLVAWDGAEPVGDVYLWREQPAPEPVRRHLGHTPTLTHLEVRPDRQGRGIGTALIAAAERVAGTLGYQRVSIGCGVDNHGARRLVERLGYRDWEHGVVDVEWDEPDDRGVLQHRRLVCHWLVKQLDSLAPHVDAWQAWEPKEAAEILARVGLAEVPWYVAGGWAVDLHLGRRTRDHEDLEVAIPRALFPAWRRALAGFDLYDVGEGRVRPLGPDDEPDPANHQVWLCEGGVWRMDTFLEPGDEVTWVCHRDDRVQLPLASVVGRTPDGIPYLLPPCVLLAKAKHQRPKDNADLEALLPELSVPARRWLAGALSTVHPGHPWIWRVIKG